MSQMNLGLALGRPYYKGMAIVVVRSWARARGLDKAIVSRLTEDDARLFETVVATAWVPVEFATNVYVEAASVLFGDDPRPICKLGRELAADNLGGVFRYVVRVMSVAGLVEKSAVIWRSFHTQGVATVHEHGPRHLELSVVDYPGLPERLREMISGWLARAVEMTGASNVRVVKSERPGPTWIWMVTWR